MNLRSGVNILAIYTHDSFINLKNISDVKVTLLITYGLLPEHMDVL